MANKYLPINWVDGMKINKTHFINEFNAVTQQQSESNQTFVNGLNFGLIPSNENAQNNLIYFSLDNQQYIELQLTQCNAITYNGLRISVGNASEGENVHLQQEISTFKFDRSQFFTEDKSAYYILLSINPYDRVPVGSIITDEVPPRHPYTMAKYSLSLIEKDQLNGDNLQNTLPIGKLIIKNDTIQLDDNYIPPCQSVASHNFLINKWEQWKQFLSKMEILTLTIIQKVYQKKQQNDLSIPIIRASESILQYLSVQLDAFNYQGLYYTPSRLLTTIAGLARTITNTLDMYVGTGKEEVYQYFTERCGIDQSMYEKAVADICHLIYSHIDCMDNYNVADRFVLLTRQLFESLASLDYIGKRKDVGIFVKEEALKIKNTGRMGTFLAD